MVPKSFDPSLSTSQIEASIAECDSNLLKIKRQAIKIYDSWAAAQRSANVMSEYNRLLRERRDWRKLLREQKKEIV